MRIKIWLEVFLHGSGVVQKLHGEAPQYSSRHQSLSRPPVNEASQNFVRSRTVPPAIAPTNQF